MIKFCSIMFSFLFLFVTILKATTVKDFSGGAFTIKPRDGHNLPYFFYIFMY